MPTTSFRFQVHHERLAIARLDADAEQPAWARGGFVNIARTPAELSIICAQGHVPSGLPAERDRIALGIEGCVPMTTIGVLAALCGALAAAQVPVFVVSTYDTDWILVRAEHFEATRAALTAQGHLLLGAPPER
jgi:hypothetical protein